MTSHQLLQDSVGLTLVSGNDRIDRTAIINTISKIVPVNQIESFGNLGDAKKWFILFKTNSSKEKMLQLEHLKVRDQIFSVHKPHRQVKLIRLLNIPSSISNDVIRDVVSKWKGTIVSVECECLPRPFSSIKTFVRRIRMKFESPNDEQNIPISFKLFGITIPVLLEGRIKVCYRCKSSGHIKSEYTALKCRVCMEIGHDDSDCTRKRSYANIAGTFSRQASTPTTDNQTIKKTPSSGIVHHSTPISSDELPSTPTVVCIRDADDFESPQLSATQECIAAVAALPPGDQEEQPDVEQQPAVHQELDVQQQPNIQQQPDTQQQTDIQQQADTQQQSVTQQPEVQQQPGVQQQSEGQQELDDERQIMLDQDNIHPNDKASNMINQAPSINFIEAYQMYKDGQNVLKRPRHDENNITINESKKQHLHISLPMEENEEEEGEI
ncbi:unnamed protein product [Rotaria sp. Silwood2]|nr:unnamed protein product [Rotaria sp. Silwood2]